MDFSMMKTPFLFLISVLSLYLGNAAAGTLSGGVFDENLTDNLGTGDPIPYVELDFRHGAVSPVSFERRELVDSNGIHWIYYFFQMPEGESTSSASWEVGGGATSASLSRSNLQFDWSSRTGITSNPFNMEIGRYYLLTITSEAPSRVSGRRTDYFYFALEAGGGTPPADDNQAPTISLSPAPGKDLQLQTDILNGNGFSIIAEDPDGINDLDWNTFQVTIAGVDKTQHFMSVAGVLVKAGRVSSSQSVDTQTFVVKPDPALFSDSHNLFNLQWNGDWPVSLRLCDKGGLCAQADYSFYTGPILKITSVADQRCANPQDTTQPIRISGFELGNIGFDVPEAAIYVGIQPQNSQTLLTYYFSNANIPLLSGDLFKLLPSLPMPSGFKLSGGEVAFPSSYLTSEHDFIPLNSGTYNFLAGVLDTSLGAIAINEQTLQVCRP